MEKGRVSDGFVVDGRAWPRGDADADSAAQGPTTEERTYQQQMLAVPNLGQLVVGHGGLGSAGYEARGRFSVRTIQGEGLGGGWESQVAVEVTMTLGD